MAQHRAQPTRRRRIRAAILGALVLALAATFAGQPAANALTLTPKGKIITSRNADVVGTCKLEVDHVDTDLGIVEITLTANARPAGLDGYRANKHTEIHCVVFDHLGSVVLTRLDLAADRPTIYPAHIDVVIPFDTSYMLCGYAYVKLKNGDDSTTPVVCA